MAYGKKFQTNRSEVRLALEEKPLKGIIHPPLFPQNLEKNLN